MCVFNVIVWYVCALVCDGVWCVCVRVCVIFMGVLFVRFVLLYLNVFVCFVWDVLCDVWFVVVCVFVCVFRLMCSYVVSVDYCVMLCDFIHVVVVCLSVL